MDCKKTGGLIRVLRLEKGFTQKTAYFVTNYGSIHTGFTLDGAHHQVSHGITHYLQAKANGAFSFPVLFYLVIFAVIMFFGAIFQKYGNRTKK